jgi:hypothetical protein
VFVVRLFDFGAFGAAIKLVDQSAFGVVEGQANGRGGGFL